MESKTCNENNSNAVDALLTAEDVAKILGFKSIQTVYRWANRGWISKISFGGRNIRFQLSEINKIKTKGVNLPENEKRYISGNSNSRVSRPKGLQHAGRRNYSWE